MRNFWIALVALAGVAGCVVEDRTDTSGTEGNSEDVPERELNVQLRVVDQAGQPVELNRFAKKTDVYLTVNVSDASNPVVAEDFTFQVNDSNGKLMSTDESRCRRFQVDNAGTIDNVATCDHAIVHLDDGTILISVAPFADALKLSLEIAAVADDERISVPFSIVQ